MLTLMFFSEFYITEENIGGLFMEYSDFRLIQGIVGHRLVENQIHLKEFCPQLPGTVLRVSIPPGATINLLNLVELTSPGGICLIYAFQF